MMPSKTNFNLKMKIVNIEGDGNCLFHSCEYLMGLQNGTIRKRIADMIRNNPNLQISDTSLLDWIRYATGSTNIRETDYATLIERNGYWGSGLELTLISMVYRKSIYVIRLYHNPPNYKKIAEYHPEFNDPLFLLYNGSHYDAIVVE